MEQFRYLGSLISVDSSLVIYIWHVKLHVVVVVVGYCKKNIRSRIEIAKKAFMDKKQMFQVKRTCN